MTTEEAHEPRAPTKGPAFMKGNERDAGDVLELGDLYVSAALVAAGLTVERISWRGGRAGFCFAKSAGLVNLLLTYFNGTLTVRAKAMADAANHLKFLLRANADAPPAARRSGWAARPDDDPDGGERGVLR